MKLDTLEFTVNDTKEVEKCWGVLRKALPGRDCANYCIGFNEYHTRGKYYIVPSNQKNICTLESKLGTSAIAFAESHAATSGEAVEDAYASIVGKYEKRGSIVVEVVQYDYTRERYVARVYAVSYVPEVHDNLVNLLLSR